MKAYLVLVLGIVAAATSALFIKSSTLGPFTLGMLRLAIGALILSPVMVYALRRERRRLTQSDVMASLPGGVLLGLHLGVWNMGVVGTSVANATLIVNLNVVAMPIAMWLMIREKLTAGELIGSAIAIAGVAVLTLAQADFSGSTLAGDLTCMAAMVLAVAYLAAGRFRAGGRSLFVYLVPLYAVAAATCAPFAFFEPQRADAWSDANVIAVLGLAIVPTVLGHSSLNYAMVHLRSQAVSLASLGQFVVAALLDYVIHRHVPAGQFYPAATLIVAGAVITVRFAPPRVKKAIDESQAESA